MYFLSSIFIFLAFSINAQNYCQELVDEESYLLAASSFERGYFASDDEVYVDDLASLIENRAHYFCEAYGCGELKSYKTTEVFAPVVASVCERNNLFQEQFLLSPEWAYVDNGHKVLGNRLWYFGHTISCLGVIGLFSLWPGYEDMATIASSSVIVLSQVITMASRKIERSKPNRLSYRQAIKRQDKGQVVNVEKIGKSRKKSHLVFSSLICGPLDPLFEEKIILGADRQ